MRRWRHCR